jgi:peroxiredoxin Q/BCP
MSVKSILLIFLFIWGTPSTYFRSKFRKIVYKTDDWKINIKPLFLKEIKALFINLYPDNKEYLKIRNYYRFYLVIYVIIFAFYFTLS